MEWAYVLYAAEEEVPTWHQRLCLGRLGSWATSAGEVAIATPDGDVYIEDYSGTCPDIAAVRFSATRWPPPPGVPTARAYRFRSEPTTAQRARFLAQGEAEAARAFGVRCRGRPPPSGGLLRPMAEEVAVAGGPPLGAAGAGGAVLPGVAGGAAGWAAGVVAPAPGPPLMGGNGVGAPWTPTPGGPPALASSLAAAGTPGVQPAVACAWMGSEPTGLGAAGEAPPGCFWVLAADVPALGLAFGARLELGGPQAQAVLLHRTGRRGLVRFTGGGDAFVVLCDSAVEGEFVRLWRGADARVLPVATVGGKRGRD